MIDFPEKPIELPSRGQLPKEVHVLDKDSYFAMQGALGAKRPLLVRGEPGVGKTQLARAAATLLKCPLIELVVDARTESRDLLWTLDAVRRLAEAQVSPSYKPEDVEQRLLVDNFVHPGPLWWAFDWKSACKQAKKVGEDERPSPKGWEADHGSVVLIDEIDKGESDVPNGLLEALGSGRFRPPGSMEPVTITGGMPLVVITTNEERVLPDAFMRRCLVLHLLLPPGEAELRDFLVARGKAHFNDQLADDVLMETAELLVKDRTAAEEKHLSPLPGQAEYLDLLRALLAIKDANKRNEAFEYMRTFVFKKHKELL